MPQDKKESATYKETVRILDKIGNKLAEVVVRLSKQRVISLTEMKNKLPKEIRPAVQQEIKKYKAKEKAALRKK